MGILAGMEERTFLTLVENNQSMLNVQLPIAIKLQATGHRSQVTGHIPIIAQT